MDEVSLVTQLRPAPPADPDELCQAARTRLSAAYHGRASALPSGDVIFIGAFEAKSGPPAAGIGLSVLSHVGKCVPLAEWLKERPGSAS